MQNKANLLDIQMNVTSVKTKDYENERLCGREKNKPKQTQFIVSLSNLFQTSPCKSGASRGLFIWIKQLLVTLDFDKAYISSNQ
jgi:hypothetical protein